MAPHDPKGTAYVTEFSGHRVRRLRTLPNGTQVSDVLVGSENAWRGNVEGVGTDARMIEPMGIVAMWDGVNPNSTYLGICDSGNDVIRRVWPHNRTMRTWLARSVAYASCWQLTRWLPNVTAPSLRTADWGGVIVAERGPNCGVYSLTSTGVVTRLMGGSGCVSGATAESGSGGPGLDVRMNAVSAIAMDPNGYVFATTHWYALWRYNPFTRTASIILGSSYGNGIDGSPVFVGSPLARFMIIYDMAIDSSGNILLADVAANTIRMLMKNSTGNYTMYNIVGGGTQQTSYGNAIPGVSAQLYNPFGLTITDAPESAVYIADTRSQRIKQLAYGTPSGSRTPSTTGTPSRTSSATATVTKGVSAVSSAFSGTIGSLPTGSSSSGGASMVTTAPDGVAFDGARNRLFITSSTAHMVWLYDVATSATSVVVGTPGVGTSTGSTMNGPRGIAVYNATAVLVVERGSHSLCWVAQAPGNGTWNVSRLVGTGSAGFNGDGTGLTSRQLSSPDSVAVHPDGSIYIADFGNARLRRVLLANNSIETAAGTGVAPTGTTVYVNNQAGTSVAIAPRAVAISEQGHVYFYSQATDGSNGRVLRLVGLGASSVVSVIAGSAAAGTTPPTGDGTAATSVGLPAVSWMSVNGAQRIALVDSASHTVRMLVPNGTSHPLNPNGANKLRLGHQVHHLALRWKLRCWQLRRRRLGTECAPKPYRHASRLGCSIRQPRWSDDRRHRVRVCARHQYQLLTYLAPCTALPRPPPRRVLTCCTLLPRFHSKLQE